MATTKCGDPAKLSSTIMPHQVPTSLASSLPMQGDLTNSQYWSTGTGNGPLLDDHQFLAETYEDDEPPIPLEVHVAHKKKDADKNGTNANPRTRRRVRVSTFDPEASQRRRTTTVAEVEDVAGVDDDDGSKDSTDNLSIGLNDALSPLDFSSDPGLQDVHTRWQQQLEEAAAAGGVEEEDTEEAPRGRGPGEDNPPNDNGLPRWTTMHSQNIWESDLPPSRMHTKPLPAHFTVKPV